MDEARAMELAGVTQDIGNMLHANRVTIVEILVVLSSLLGQAYQMTGCDDSIFAMVKNSAIATAHLMEEGTKLH
jgi:hypothetical protein